MKSRQRKPDSPAVEGWLDFIVYTCYVFILGGLLLAVFSMEGSAVSDLVCVAGALFTFVK